MSMTEGILTQALWLCAQPCQSQAGLSQGHILCLVIPLQLCSHQLRAQCEAHEVTQLLKKSFGEETP